MGFAEVSPFEAVEAPLEIRNKLKTDRQGYGAPSSAFLYGAHAVRAALLNPKRVLQRLLVTDSGYELIREAHDKARNDGLAVPEPTFVEGYDLERLLPRDAVHQGILLDAQPPEEVFLADVLNAAGEKSVVLVLDQVTDPHNVGAILRSAAAFGATAVVVQKLHAPDITGTLAKSASGAVEHVPVVREVNLTRALEQLKEAGYFCVGLAERGKQTLAELEAPAKVALVLGAEGDGLRRLVSETCDTLARLPTGGPIGSLNVSNAAAVALYELARNG
jgi:23S rRNA (guanosine2251-2'-O)-methyltransferase